MRNPFSSFRRDKKSAKPDAAKPIHSVRDGAEETMSFDFSHDDLVNVVQFLSLASRTGSLKVESSTTGEIGVIGFNRGTVCFTEFGGAEGTEAMAQMMRTAGLKGEFITHDDLGKTNVEVANEELLAEAATQAERLKPRGGKTVAARSVVKSAEDLRASRKGMVTKGMSDIEESGEPSARKTRLGKRTGVEKPMIETVDSTLKVTGAGEGRERPLDVVRSAPTRGHRREIIGVLITVCVGIVMLGSGVWWVLKKIEDQKANQAEERMLKEEQGREQEKATAADALVVEAKGLYERGDFNLALEKLEQALLLKPGMSVALELRDTVEDATYREAALPIRAEARQLMDQVGKVGEVAYFSSQVEQVLTDIQKGEALFDEGLYQESLSLYQKALLQEMALLRQAEQYGTAVRCRDLAESAKAQAEEVLAPRLAPDIWQVANGHFVAAFKAFENERFEDATTNWQSAEEKFIQAAGDASGVSDVMATAAEFEEVVQEFGRDRLEKYAPDAWSSILGQTVEARELGGDNSETALGLWKSARERLDLAMAAAEDREVEIKYENALNAAKKFADSGRWSEALEKLETALSCPGYEDDDAAKSMMDNVRYRVELEKARASLSSGEWQSVLKAAGAALSFNPRSEEAQRLVNRASDELIPRLTVVVHRRGVVADDAIVRIKGLDRKFVAPVTFKLKKDQEYTIEATLPPEGNTYYATTVVEFSVEKLGRQRLDLDVVRLSPPDPGAGTDWQVPGIERLIMQPVPEGRFTMGSKSGKSDEEPVREVIISRPFWMARFELSNEQFRYFLRETGYGGDDDAIGAYLKHFRDGGSMPVGDDYPVVYVSWENACNFTEWLTRRERSGGRLPDGYEYRLPTEAEWEYCCRAGHALNFSGVPREVAWFSLASGARQIGTKAPNDWGIFDLHGNVWEWCRDYYGVYPDLRRETDPVGASTGTFRVIRGGSWSNAADLCRCSYRSMAASKEAKANIGFRVVLAPIID
jgi:formylglycine-generating enzyme required for sulfatase activity/tetratricopeptide (TPR) repeat protein